MQTNVHETEWLAKELRLPYIRANLKKMVSEAAENGWEPEVFLNALFEGEFKARKEKKAKARIKAAGFSQLRYLEQLEKDCLPDGLKRHLADFEKLDFIKDGRNIVLYGSPGTGKTHTAIGLGIKACMQGYSVLFTTVPHMVTQIKECKAEKKLHLLEKKFQNYDLVICDEFGYVSCDKEAGELLFNHISLRAGAKSTIVTTNLSFDRWGEVIKDKILVAAMVDRLTHNAYLINMNGESYRLKQTKEFNMQT